MTKVWNERERERERGGIRRGVKLGTREARGGLTRLTCMDSNLFKWLGFKIKRLIFNFNL